jgi:hypothetical protein
MNRGASEHAYGKVREFFSVDFRYKLSGHPFCKSPVQNRARQETLLKGVSSWFDATHMSFYLAGVSFRACR